MRSGLKFLLSCVLGYYAHMAEHARQLHDEWKILDELARGAERQLTKTWDDFFAGQADAPNEAAVDAAREMRAVASAKLAELTAYMSGATSGSRRRV